MAEVDSASLRIGETINLPNKSLDIKDLLALAREGKVESRGIDLRRIEDQLTEETGVIFPDSLANQLGFHDLAWTELAHPQSLSSLFLGHSGDDKTVDSAVGTIEIGRVVDHHATEPLGLGISQHPDTVFPGSLRIAGIEGQSHRIYTARFTLGHGNPLEQSQMTLTPEEALRVNTAARHRVRSEAYRDTLTPFPADPKNIFHRDAALVTPGMIDHATKHGVAPQYAVNLRREWNHPNKTNFYHLGDMTFILEDMGFKFGSGFNKQSVEVEIPRELDSRFKPQLPPRRSGA